MTVVLLVLSSKATIKQLYSRDPLELGFDWKNHSNRQPIQWDQRVDFKVNRELVTKPVFFFFFFFYIYIYIRIGHLNILREPLEPGFNLKNCLNREPVQPGQRVYFNF